MAMQYYSHTYELNPYRGGGGLLLLGNKYNFDPYMYELNAALLVNCLSSDKCNVGPYNMCNCNAV